MNTFLRRLAVLILILSVALAGCMEKRPDQDDSDAGNALSNTFVEPADIIAAAAALAPRFFEESPIDESYFDEYRYNLNQVYADDGEQQYLAAFSNGLGHQGVAMIFLLENGLKNPIYFNRHGERIESVRLFIPDYSDLLFLEVVSYGASGSHSAQRVELLLIDGRKVHPAWDYWSVQVDSRGVINGDAVELAHTHAAWVLVPAYQASPGPGDGPEIYVSEISSLYRVDGEGKAVMLEETKRNLTYKWDPSTRNFIETAE